MIVWAAESGPTASTTATKGAARAGAVSAGYNAAVIVHVLREPREVGGVAEEPEKGLEEGEREIPLLPPENRSRSPTGRWWSSIRVE